MGCAPSTMPTSPAGSPTLKRRRSTATVASLDALTDQQVATSIKTRYGHPSHFHADGYDIGLRVRVKNLHQSFFVGCSRQSGDKITIKEHHLKNYADDDQSAVNEVMILSKLSHPAIPHLHEVFYTESAAYLVMDYLDPYRLFNYIDWQSEKSRISITDARFIFKTLTNAVLHCHERGVIIRDLTPMNILVKKNFPTANSSSSSSSNAVMAPYEVKIVDFSLAVREGSKDALCDHALFEWAMVPYCAPEALQVQTMKRDDSENNHPNDHHHNDHVRGYSRAMDMWSLGVLLFVMISGRIPWEGFERNCTVDDHILLSNIQRAEYDMDDEVWKKEAGEGVKKVIRKLLQVNVEQRMTAKELMKNAWVTM